MSIPNFDHFIKMYPKYKKFTNSVNAQKVYDFLAVLENIEKMIASNSNGRPALYGIQADLESQYNDLPEFDFNIGFVKQCVGTMIRTILEPLGYIPLLQRDLPKGESKYFTSAMYYAYDSDSAKYELIKELTLVPVKR